jgi:hypothetical protein
VSYDHWKTTNHADEELGSERQDHRPRVELHPATDRWMMGDRYGTVIKDERKGETWVYTVKLDKSGKMIRVCDELIARWL